MEIHLLRLLVRRLDTKAIIPSKAHASTFADACYDLFSTSDVTIEPGEQQLIATGLNILIPADYWAKFHERSGLAVKGIQVMAGVIDSGYTGEWKVILRNTSNSPITIPYGKAITQFSVERVTPCEITEITDAAFNELAASRLRKDTGFGNSDNNRK